ncbi:MULTISPECIES: alkaline phosphatase [unclassified Oceanobacter]|jgi:alkaline phosphatase D|uniref:alkaline phosphatase D family protein n=1 Tax=unclassified Oceanobacter TaxID=2620260 RepID=UPI002735A358|nr:MULTISPECIES: alkaline phosphatase D family protein [unclassified Oceanobacter]MDP2506064.1 alkaline phosphatase D family protein [Oceanobacter sp. 3_MG-2023]MDP2609017.1 alkaline phosphatase D family protein [Oceanobacter sp. 1_MG-2023]MDP2611998.1 alkaline phosphatase D family protein [Oceanobacter sp. 2_MG-2023]
MALTRREFLLDSASTSLFAPVVKPGGKRTPYPFQHGIASGDPLTDQVLLWTRITTTGSAFGISYRWLITTDPQLQQVVQEGTGFTDASRDFTVKVDVGGLQPATTYYYAFEADGHYSDVGRTRTLPEGSVAHLRIAYTSCSNFAKGYFNVYRELAQRADLDAILHLGDYIYEYADLDDCLHSGRINVPLHETRSLQDYRQRHACYKQDKDLQEVHRQHPFLVIWDDHEVANNAWTGGADNHDIESEGDWRSRLSGAVQAYLEWMPIREPSQPEMGIYRSFRFGDLVDLSMLDTRLAGRDAQAESMEERNLPGRTLLGYSQEEWLYTNLANAQQQGVTWKLSGQQVMVAQLGTNDMPFNYDQWDGYPAARQRLFDAVSQANVDNWVVLTGDIHSSWAFELYQNPFAAETGKPLGVEFVTPAVTSPGIESYAQAQMAAASLEALLPHLAFVNFYFRGYVLLDITHDRLQAEWWVVDNIDSHRYSSDCLRALQVPQGSNQLQPAQGITQAKAAQPLAPAFADDLAFLRHWKQRYNHLDGVLANHTERGAL